MTCVKTGTVKITMEKDNYECIWQGKNSLQVHFGMQRNCTVLLVLWFVILKDILVEKQTNKQKAHYSVSRHQQISQSNENHIQILN